MSNFKGLQTLSAVMLSVAASHYSLETPRDLAPLPCNVISPLTSFLVFLKCPVVPASGLLHVLFLLPGAVFLVFPYSLWLILLIPQKPSLTTHPTVPLLVHLWPLCLIIILYFLHHCFHQHHLYLSQPPIGIAP